MQRKKSLRASGVRNRIFEMVSVGVINNRLNQSYDIISTLALVINLVAAFASTYDNVTARFGGILSAIETVTVFFFAIDYVLRLITSDYLYPDLPISKATVKYVFSAAGIVDLLSFLPFYLPFFFPAGTATFRLFRVARIFRLFRINAYYDSLNVITEVLEAKKQQLLSSVFIIILLMFASSLCMYSVEHAVQPDVFKNAFSGIWWAASTLLTIGYGDIYPVTLIGKIFGILIGFLGVGVVAIPTGIISAGFVEHYTRIKTIGDLTSEGNVRFITLSISKDDSWCDKEIRELALPKGMLIASVERDDNTLLPRGDIKLQDGDRLVLAAEAIENEIPIRIKELTLKAENPWVGCKIKELDISRRTYIVMIKRNGRSIVPHGKTVLEVNDVLIMFTSGKGTFLEEHPF